LQYEGMNSEDLEDLKIDLCQRVYDFDKLKIRLEKKKDFKARIGRSPDIGDALALALYSRSSGSAVGSYVIPKCNPYTRY